MRHFEMAKKPEVRDYIYKKKRQNPRVNQLLRVGNSFYFELKKMFQYSQQLHLWWWVAHLKQCGPCYISCSQSTIPTDITKEAAV